MQDARQEGSRLQQVRLERIRWRKPVPGAVAIFLRSFAVMAQCGVNMHSSLSMLALQSEDQAIRLAADEMGVAISRGNPLSRAMAAHPHVFSDFQVGLVQVAERSGRLDEVLSKLADYEERTQATTRKVKAALTYPAFIFSVCMIMLIFAPPFLFAGIFPMLKSMGQDLPLITQAVIGFSEAVRNPFFILLIALGAYAVGRYLIHLFNHPKKRVQTYRRLMRFPALGDLLGSVATSRFCRSLSVQLASGNNVLEALKLAGQIAQNPVLAEAMPECIKQFSNGRAFHRCLQETRFFPGMLVHMVKVGEETGDLSHMLGLLGDWYDDDIDHRVGTFAALVEPLVMLIMGVCVGTLIIALMLPLMNLINTM